MKRLLVFAFILMWFFTADAVFNASSYLSCQKACKCTSNGAKIAVKCRLEENITSLLHLPPNINELDLSNSNLTDVPTHLLKKHKGISKLILDGNSIKELKANSFQSLSSLEHLSLRKNRIYTIGTGSFTGLDSLKSLNLSINDLHIWKESNLSRDMPKLETVDITGAIFWIPTPMLLNIPTLKEIIGVTWCKFCKNCTLVNPDNLVNDTTRRVAARKCLNRFSGYKYLQIGKKDPKRFVSHGFVPECMCVKGTECEFRQLVMPYFNAQNTLPQYLFYLEYVISPFTILANLFVFILIIARKCLRNTAAFCLILNIALIDIFVGIYSITVAETNIKHISQTLEELMWTGQKLRPSTGPIFIAGQLISVLITSILTIERYIAVVYCTTTNIKLTMTPTLILLAFAWFASGIFAILPLFGVAGLRYNIKRACAPLSYDVEYQSESTFVLIAMLSLIVFLYFTNIPMYYKIFHFVKKNTGNTGGVKKEVSLARKIASLICTKFVFFAVPILLILIVSIFSEYSDNPFDFHGDAFQSTMFKIIIGQWLPVTCLNINALLDPFLYAFRHSLFKREYRYLVHRYTGKVMPQSDESRTNEKTMSVITTN